MIEDASKAQAADKSWEETIEHDHHAIKEILERLEATMDPHLLLPILEELRMSLVEHFAREEAPEGLHELISTMSPNTVASLQNVLGEHEDFLVRLDSLIERTRKVVRGPLAEILRDAMALSESLHDHEARETELFTDSVFTDLGRSS